MTNHYRQHRNENRRGGYSNPRTKQQGQREPFSGPIPSPYNFVPLSDRVVFPEWSRLVSQDVPFKDGLSGHIDIEIEAVTPIYIRNGGDHPEPTEERRNDREYQDFFKIEPSGTGYAIPGTSIKGAVRSVFEIISFSRLSRINDKNLAFRDLQNQKLFTNRLTKRLPDPDGGKELWMARAQAGFLRESDGKWILTPCQFSRIKHSDLNAAFGWNMPKVRGYESVSAKRKYEQWERGHSLEIAFKKNDLAKHNGKFLYRLATDVGMGPDRGILVFTGQPNAKKNKEFVFHDRDSHAWDVTSLRKQFLQSHTEGENRSESWDYWYPHLKSGSEVPVFYLPDDKGTPTSMGLAQMYRLPFKKSLAKSLPQEHTNEPSMERLDLAEVIFGYVANGTSHALRGRLAFETARCTSLPNCKRELKQTVLGGPKPSFYPNYIDQTKVSAGQGRVRKTEVEGAKGKHPDYLTLNDSGVRLRGWKRYPVHNPGNVGDVPPPPENRNDEINWDTVSSFLPLPAGTKFEGRISYHNLRPVELGGLLWALEWGGDSTLCHSVGMAKPFGFGAIRIHAKLTSVRSNDMQRQAVPEDPAEYRGKFESFMETRLQAKGAKWKQSPQMQELLAMANPGRTACGSALRYPRLRPRERVNDFVEMKKAGAFLLPYSELVRMNPDNRVSAESASSAQYPIAKGDIIESIGAELRTNKKGRQSWRILFEVKGERLEGLLHDSAKSRMPAQFGPESRYRFKIMSFSEANYRENILLDFADDPPAPLP